MSKKTTQGQALDIASRHMIREGVNQWTWARTKRASSADAWMVTLGNQDHALWRIVVSDAGVVVSTEPVLV